MGRAVGRHQLENRRWKRRGGKDSLSGESAHRARRKAGASARRSGWTKKTADSVEMLSDGQQEEYMQAPVQTEYMQAPMQTEYVEAPVREEYMEATAPKQCLRCGC